MMRKIIPSRNCATLGFEPDGEAEAQRELLVRQLIEQARNGGKAERDDFQRELNLWNAQRRAKTLSLS